MHPAAGPALDLTRPAPSHLLGRRLAEAVPPLRSRRPAQRHGTSPPSARPVGPRRSPDARSRPAPA
eukprot:2213062-Pyramimonas_sp.AAC.1